MKIALASKFISSIVSSEDPMVVTRFSNMEIYKTMRADYENMFFACGGKSFVLAYSPDTVEGTEVVFLFRFGENDDKNKFLKMCSSYENSVIDLQIMEDIAEKVFVDSEEDGEEVL